MSVTISQLRVSDRRELTAHVSGAPGLRTAGGRDPIDPCFVRATYSITTGELYGAIVHGWRGQDLGRVVVRRRVENLITAPLWLRDLIEEQRP